MFLKIPHFYCNLRFDINRIKLFELMETMEEGEKDGFHIIMSYDGTEYQSEDFDSYTEVETALDEVCDFIREKKLSWDKLVLS